MNDCKLDCFNCPYDDCLLDGMRIEDYVNEMTIDRLLGNSEDAQRTRKALYYAANRELFRKKNKAYYEKVRKNKKGEKNENQ